MNEKAKEALYELKHKNQLVLEFPDQSDMTGLRTAGEYHQGADLVLGTLMDLLGFHPPIPHSLVNWSLPDFFSRYLRSARFHFSIAVSVPILKWCQRSSKTEPFRS